MGNNIRNAVAAASYFHIYCGPASCHVAVHYCSHNDYRQMKVVNVQVAGNHKQNINQFLRTMSFYRMAFFRGFFIPARAVEKQFSTLTTSLIALLCDMKIAILRLL